MCACRSPVRCCNAIATSSDAIVAARPEMKLRQETLFGASVSLRRTLDTPNGWSSTSLVCCNAELYTVPADGDWLHLTESIPVRDVAIGSDCPPDLPLNAHRRLEDGCSPALQGHRFWGIAKPPSNTTCTVIEERSARSGARPLHLGAGPKYLPGFVNISATSLTARSSRAGRHGPSLASNSADSIYSTHIRALLSG